MPPRRLRLVRRLSPAAAICSADFTASIVTVVMIAVPSIFAPSARHPPIASFIIGYIAIAAAICSADAPANIPPYSFCA